MAASKTEAAKATERKSPEHVDAGAWLDSIGPKHARAAQNVPGVMTRIKDGLRAARDLEPARARVTRLLDEMHAAEMVAEALSVKATTTLAAVKAELDPIAAVLP